MEVIEKSTESLERLSLQFEKRIKDVEKLGEDTSALWKELSELQEYVNISREDLQSIRMYFWSFLKKSINTSNHTHQSKNHQLWTNLHYDDPFLCL